METVTRLALNLTSFRYPDGTVALSDINIEIKKGGYLLASLAQTDPGRQRSSR